MKQNLRSTNIVPRKLCFKYFVLYLTIRCAYNIMLNSSKSVSRGFAFKFRQSDLADELNFGLFSFPEK